VTRSPESPPPQVPSAETLPHMGEAPLQRGPERMRTVFVVTFAAACLPLGAGIAFFGWRAAWVTAVAIASCAALERLYFHVTRTPALLGRSHAYLTGVLLALTLPPFTPLYVVVLASAFAILVGKAIFGGVGHFLWQPALVGRFAVAVIIPTLLQIPGLAEHRQTITLEPEHWPLLRRAYMVYGDIGQIDRQSSFQHYRGWQVDYATDPSLGQQLRAEDPGFSLPHPADTLHDLTRLDGEPEFSALADVRDMPHRKPIALTALPPIRDLLFGARPGSIGETCAVALLVGGLYLVYRNYVKWQLPIAMLASAAVVAAVAPVKLAGPNQTVEWVWLPIVAESFDVGFTYVSYQLLSGGLLLAAFFLAPEMTSRPITAGGQALFGVGCGIAAMLMKLYLNTSIPTYVAVLAMNTFTPTIDMIWQPRVFGQKRFAWQRKS
jgi:Na+-translocating ferredoxin:NAD+ oxidoreductase subunit D